MVNKFAKILAKNWRELLNEAKNLTGYTDAQLFWYEKLGIYKYVSCIKCYTKNDNPISKETGQTLFVLLNHPNIKEIWREQKKKWEKIGYLPSNYLNKK